MKGTATSILFASDLHASTLCFKNLIAEAIQRRVTAVVVGGDLTGKYPTFIVAKRGSWESEVLGRARTARSDLELKELKEDIENVGSYPIIISPQEKLDLDRQYQSEKKSEYQHTIKQYLLNEGPIRVRNWLVYADQELLPNRIRFLLMCGNDDEKSIDTTIAEFPLAENPDAKLIQLESHYVVGESAARETPFNCPRDLSETALQNRLFPKIAQIPEKDMKNAIFVFHCPPRNTPLDQAFATDNEGRTTTAAGHVINIPAGSETIRSAIKIHQPLLSLHGHVHSAMMVTN